MSLLGSDAPLLLVYREMSPVEDARLVSLMLSPHFYVLKKESLPLRYAYQAKRVAPSILDELTGEGDFRYAVFREEEMWVFVAYDLKRLEQFLLEKGIPFVQVQKIYFAQQAKEQFERPVEIGDKDILITVDGAVVIAPKSLLSDEVSVEFGGAFRPEKGFVPEQNRRSLLSQVHAITIALLLLLLAGGYVAEGKRYSGALVALESKVAEATREHPSLQSGYKRRAIYEKYTEIDKPQRKIREKIISISRLLSKESKLMQLTVTPKKYSVTIGIAENKRAVLQKIADSMGLKIKRTKSNQILELEGSL